MIPSCRLAILHIDLTWSDHVRLDDKVGEGYFTCCLPLFLFIEKSFHVNERQKIRHYRGRSTGE